MGDERDDVAEELRQVRDEARRRARPLGGADSTPTPAPTRHPGDTTPRRTREDGPATDPVVPLAPDAAAVNAAWPAEAGPPRGLGGLLRRLLERILQPRFEAQRLFNSHQVRLDNEMLGYLERRSAATHRHYDRLLGDLGRRLDEADERHAGLEKELVGHVQDLVRRIDLVLGDANRGRAALDFALEDVRERLARMEKTLRRTE